MHRPSSDGFVIGVDIDMSVTELSPPSSRFAVKRFEHALAYWDDKRNGRTMPARADIQPLEIPHVSANVVLIDVLADPLDFRYAYIGEAVIARIELDYTGMRFTDIPHQRPGSRVWQAGVRLVQEAMPFYSDIPYVGPDAFVEAYQDLYLPVSDNGKTVDMIFGVIEFEQRP